MARPAFWCVSAIYAGLLVVAWRVLPERVPVHFGLTGEPDRYDDRGSALLFLVILGAAMVVLLAGLARWAPRVPHQLINLPPRTKEWWLATPEREAELRGRLAEDLWWIGAMTMALLVVVQGEMILAARTAEPRLSVWFFVALGCYLVAITGYVVRMARVRHRRAAEGA